MEPIGTICRALGFGFGAFALLAFSGCQKPAAQAAPPAPTVGVVESRRMSVPIEVTPNGTTRALEDVTIRARVRGFLTERHFAEGAMVKKGQLLLVIDEEPYQVALQSARARQAEADAAPRRPRNRRGARSPRRNWSSTGPSWCSPRSRSGATAPCSTRNAGSAEDLDKTEADRKRWESQVEADRAHLAQAKADYAVGIASAQAQVSAARAAVRDAELNLGYCRMYAPLDGRIGEARVKVGNLVGPDQAGGGAFTDLATIQQLDPMGVDVRLSSRDLDRTTALIGGGLAVRLTRPGPSGPQGASLRGPVLLHRQHGRRDHLDLPGQGDIPQPRRQAPPGRVRQGPDGGRPARERRGGPRPFGRRVRFGDDRPRRRRGGQGGRPAGRRGPDPRGAAGDHQGPRSGASVIVDGLQMIRPGLSVKTEPAC